VSLPPLPHTSRPQASAPSVAEGPPAAGFKAWVRRGREGRRVVRLEVLGEGCRRSPERGVIFAAAAASHVATVGERAGCRRGSDREASAPRQVLSWG
jgi:hypothetical protein